MHKDHRMQALTRGLGQMKQPELARLRRELKSGTKPLLTGQIRDPDCHY